MTTLTELIRQQAEQPFPAMKVWAELELEEQYARAKTLHTRLLHAARELDSVDIEAMRREVADTVHGSEDIAAKLVELGDLYDQSIRRAVRWAYIWGFVFGVTTIVAAAAVVIAVVP